MPVCECAGLATVEKLTTSTRRTHLRSCAKEGRACLERQELLLRFFAVQRLANPYADASSTWLGLHPSPDTTTDHFPIGHYDDADETTRAMLKSCARFELRCGGECLQLASHSLVAEQWVVDLRFHALLNYHKQPLLDHTRITVEWPDGVTRPMAINAQTSAMQVIRTMVRRRFRVAKVDAAATKKAEKAIEDLVNEWCLCEVQTHARAGLNAPGEELPLHKLPSNELVLDQVLLRWEETMRREYGLTTAMPKVRLAVAADEPPPPLSEDMPTGTPSSGPPAAAESPRVDAFRLVLRKVERGAPMLSTSAVRKPSYATWLAHSDVEIIRALELRQAKADLLCGRYIQSFGGPTDAYRLPYLHEDEIFELGAVLALTVQSDFAKKKMQLRYEAAAKRHGEAGRNSLTDEKIVMLSAEELKLDAIPLHEALPKRMWQDADDEDAEAKSSAWAALEQVHTPVLLPYTPTLHSYLTLLPSCSHMSRPPPYLPAAAHRLKSCLTHHPPRGALLLPPRILPLERRILARLGET